MTDSTVAAEGGGAFVGLTRRSPPALLARVLRFDIWVTGLIFVALTALTFLGVVMRYFLNDPIVWLEEVQVAMFLAVVFLGAGSAFRYGSHVAIDFLVELFPAPVRRVVAYAVHVIVVGVLAYFAWQGAGLASSMADANRLTNILKIPAVVIYSTIPAGLVWAIINYLYATLYGEEEAGEVSF